MLGTLSFGAEHTAVTAMQAALAATYVTTLTQLLRVSLRLRKHYGAGPSADRIRRLVQRRAADLSDRRCRLPADQCGCRRRRPLPAAGRGRAFILPLRKPWHWCSSSISRSRPPPARAFPRSSPKATRSALAAFAGETAQWTLLAGARRRALRVLPPAHLLLSLFGAAFTAGYWLMVILFAGILAKALVGPGEVLLIDGWQAEPLRRCFMRCALAANIALNIALIPHFGIDGCGDRTASAMVVEAILLHIAVRRTLGIVLFAFADPPTASFCKKAS